jgi:hypothetical protein
MRRALALILVNVVVFLALAELLGIVLYYEDTGHFFYLHRKLYENLGGSGERRLTADGLHPYFGPTHAPGTPFDIPEALRASPSAPARLKTNNFGFVSPFDYPFVKTGSDQFTIGITGGSVGAWFCHVGARRLIDDLKAQPYFRSRDIVPLCLAHEGYKQPQQLLLLSYFLSIGQTFDLVVNIDGFNEVAIGSLNAQRGLDSSMPSVMHLEPLINLVDRGTLTPDKLESLAAIETYRGRVNRLVERLKTNRLASVNFVLDRLYRSARASYQTESGRFNNLPSNGSTTSLIMPTRPIAMPAGATVFEALASTWVNASMSMHALLAARGTPYVHVVQPNQYYTTRRFSREEAQIALSESSPFRAGAAQGYPVLLAAAESARMRQTIAFLDGTHIFDGEPAAVYIDDCCHYTLRGNQLLADFIANGVLVGPGPWRSAP